MKTTELNLIPIFVAIYEEQSLSKAAKRLSISQPAVSKSLKRLREVYDDPLFNRSVDGVVPTSFAMDIYPAFEAALANFNSTLTASRDFDPKNSNKTFSIACISVFGNSWINSLIRQVEEKGPQINLEVHPLFSQDAEKDLRLQRYDLVIDIAPNARSVLKHERLMVENACVAFSENHPRLCQKQSITKEDFFNEKHVALSRWQVRKTLLNNEHGDDLEARQITHRMPGAGEMLSVVECTDHICILPKSTLEYFKPLYAIKTVPLPFENTHFDICAIWHPSRTHDSAHTWLRQQLQLAVHHLNI